MERQFAAARDLFRKHVHHVQSAPNCASPSPRTSLLSLRLSGARPLFSRPPLREKARQLRAICGPTQAQLEQPNSSSSGPKFLLGDAHLGTSGGLHASLSLCLQRTPIGLLISLSTVRAGGKLNAEKWHHSFSAVEEAEAKRASRLVARFLARLLAFLPLYLLAGSHRAAQFKMID